MTLTLAELRAEAGLTQRELAEQLKVSPGAIGMWESGARVPRLPTLRQLAEYFSRRLGRVVRVDDLSFGLDANEMRATRKSS